LDRQLVERARQGDREAYEALGRASARRLYPIAYRIVRDVDQADDAVQRTLVAIWREIPKLRDPDRFEAWTYRLVVRFAMAEIRRARPVTPEWTDAHSSSAVDDTAAVDERDHLESAFRQLTPEHRAVIVLHHYAGLTVAEVADVVGVPFGTAASRLHYATRAMRRALIGNDEAPLAREQTA
jgi:RNA polymerase sigma-70 factor (ECF subfamily)